MGRRAGTEFFGTSLLLFAIVGSGIVVEESSSDPVLRLLAHAVVVGGVLALLIALLGPVYGAHLNPAVTLVFWRSRGVTGRIAGAYISLKLSERSLVWCWPTPASRDRSFRPRAWFGTASVGHWRRWCQPWSSFF